MPLPNSATELDEAASKIMKAIAHTKIDKNEAQADRKDEHRDGSYSESSNW